MRNEENTAYYLGGLCWILKGRVFFFLGRVFELMKENFTSTLPARNHADLADK